MPIVPSGLSRGLYDSIRDRVRQVMGPQDAAEAGGSGGSGLTTGLWDNIRKRVQNLFGGGSRPAPTDVGAPPPAGPPPQMTGLSQQEILLRFQEGGRGRVLVLMLYNNVWRHVEPYSFRFRAKGPNPLMYGWCRVHNEIHSFRVDRVQGIGLTDERYAPRFPVEF